MLRQALWLALCAGLVFGCSTALSAEGDFRARLRALGEQHGIEVTTPTTPYKYEGESGWGEAQAASDWELEMFTPILVEEIGLYPRSFLRKIGVKGIILVRDLWIREENLKQNVSGYIFDNWVVMSVSYNYKVNLRDKQRRYLHHLIWHQFDGFKGMMWEDPEWVALNPPGFRYGVHTKGGIYDRSSESGLLSTQYPGFVNRYGTGYLPDDKADLFAYLIVLHHWVQERTQADRSLQAKARLIKKRLAEFDPAFDAAFWTRIDGIRRDLRLYVTP
jgi:hypothetical protein